MQRSLAWRNLGDGATEHVDFTMDGRRALGEGTVRSARGELVVAYRVECDAAWRVRRLEARSDQARISLSADGAGHWSKAGKPAPQLDGCIDVDIQATPFTNTIPIRRLQLAEGQAQALRVVYVAVPSLAASAVLQTYTCLRTGQGYRYEGYPAGFTADLTVDQDGFVLDYPGLFERT